MVESKKPKKGGGSRSGKIQTIDQAIAVGIAIGSHGGSGKKPAKKKK